MTCMSTFKSKWEKERHFDSTHLKTRYKCDHCTKSYSRQSRLNYHLKSHFLTRGELLERAFAPLKKGKTRVTSSNITEETFNTTTRRQEILNREVCNPDNIRTVAEKIWVAWGLITVNKEDDLPLPSVIVNLENRKSPDLTQLRADNFDKFIWTLGEKIHEDFFRPTPVTIEMGTGPIQDELFVEPQATINTGEKVYFNLDGPGPHPVNWWGNELPEVTNDHQPTPTTIDPTHNINTSSSSTLLDTLDFTACVVGSDFGPTGDSMLDYLGTDGELDPVRSHAIVCASLGLPPDTGLPEQSNQATTQYRETPTNIFTMGL